MQTLARLFLLAALLVIALGARPRHTNLADGPVPWPKAVIQLADGPVPWPKTMIQLADGPVPWPKLNDLGVAIPERGSTFVVTG